MLIDFNYIIIYGPKLHQHINSWVFYGFYKAFLYKRFNVIWVNQENREILDNYDLSNSLFLTDDIHDNNIPLINDCFYLLYKNYKSKYNDYNRLHINIYRNDIGEYTKWKNNDYIRYSLESKELYFPLATELLPEEILENQKCGIFEHSNVTRNISILHQNIKNNSQLYGDLKKVCNNNYYRLCLINNFDSSQRIQTVSCSEVNPIIHSQDQIDHNEINHEIFQIISYGGFPVTNSRYTANLFEEDCVYYSENASELILNGIDHKNNNFEDLSKWKVLDYIKNNHTYVKRLDTIFWILLRM